MKSCVAVALVLALPTISLTTGCSAYARQASPMFVGALIGGGAVIAATSNANVQHDSESVSSDDEDEEVSRDTSELLNAPPPSAAMGKSDDVNGIPVGALRAAVAKTDLAACRDELDGADLPRGYGHARVTLSPDGRVLKVVIDRPRGMSASAVKCVGDKLVQVRVDAFEGKPTTVGTTWFVP